MSDTALMYPIELRGQGVLLRDFRHDDAAAALRIVGDDAVTQWLSFDSRDHAGAQAMVDGAIKRGQQEPRTEFYLGVALLASGELIGFARLAYAGVKAGKLGYAIRADQWGHGYATDAARTLIEFGFGQLGLHRISAAIGPDNTASIKLVERLGMSPEGRIRDHVFTNGAWRDSLLYAVLAHEWASAQREVRQAA